MTESWEEKTERLEREYQARIDRLREELDCGQDGPCAKSPGCNRHWEERNRELVKRVAELENEKAEVSEYAEELAAMVGDLQSQLEAKDKRVTELNHETMSWSEKVDTETYWQTGLRELEIQNAALTKRVAELERCMQEVGLLAFMRDATPGDITAHMTRVMDSYVQRIAELQAQLAWTPVSAGLPTEPGTYEFLSHALHIHVFTLETDVTTYPWVLIGVDERWDATEIEDGYTDFRRIELPKDGET